MLSLTYNYSKGFWEAGGQQQNVMNSKWSFIHNVNKQSEKYHRLCLFFINHKYKLFYIYNGKYFLLKTYSTQYSWTLTSAIHLSRTDILLFCREYTVLISALQIEIGALMCNMTVYKPSVKTCNKPLPE